jgi:site-specific recombinase XerD
VTSQNIKDYLVELTNLEKSDSYTNQAVNSIRFFFTYVLNKKIKDYLVIRPKKAKTNPVLLSDSELSSLFEKCNNLKHLAILSLLYGAGLRVSEVVNMKLQDIDSKCMVIHVLNGKGRKSRQVMLDVNVLETLRKYYVVFKPQKYLFNGQLSEQYSVRSIQALVKTYARKAAIKKRTYPHLLRHGFCTGVLETGGGLHDAQILLGHQNIKTTIGYAHLSTKYISSIKSPISTL